MFVYMKIAKHMYAKIDRKSLVQDSGNYKSVNTAANTTSPLSAMETIFTIRSLTVLMTIFPTIPDFCRNL